MIALPRGTDVLALATAWFPAARWSREPGRAAAARPMAGARFRGMAVTAVPGPGLLDLDGAAEVVGPFPLAAADARATGLPPRESDLYGVPVTGLGDVAAGWATAVARRTGGAILPADRSRALVPDPHASVDLTLWSPVPVPPRDALPLLRPSLSGSRVGPVETAGRPDGPAEFSLTASYEYDGQVVVRCARSHEVPAVLSTLDWRAHGPWAYRVSWLPPDPVELEVEQPSQLHVIARQRVTPGICRVVATLWRTAGGTVVDAGGFVVTPEELDERVRTARR